jgi:hypothetical protein
MCNELRIAQQNLRRSKAATAEFGCRALELDIDVALLQEPYVYKGRTTGIGSRARVFEVAPAAASIVVFNPTLCVTCLTNRSDSWRTVVHIAAPGIDLHLVSAYFQYGHPAGPHLSGLSTTTDILRNRNIVVGADLNARSPLWGSAPQVSESRPPRSVRDDEIAAYVVGSGLEIAFDVRGPSVPTFSSAMGESTPDATLFSLRSPMKMKFWRVHPDECLSDHRLITFVLTTSAPHSAAEPKPPISILPRRFKCERADWDGFTHDLQRQLDKEARHLDPDNVEKKAEALQIALLTAANCNIPRFRQQKLGDSNRKKQPGWWTTAHDAARRAALKARKKMFKEGTKRGSCIVTVETPENDPFRAIQKKWKTALRQYKYLIRKAKRTHWTNFVTRECKENVWGGHYRIVKMPNGAASSLADVRDVNGVCALNSIQAAKNILKALLPDDNPAEDTERQRHIRRRAEFITKTHPSHPITEPEVAAALRRVRTKVSPGLDCISGPIIKKAWPTAGPVITIVMDEALRKGMFPDCWKPGKLVILTKPGDKSKTDPKAYRPITLLPAMGKLFEKILVARLEAHLAANAPLSTRQFGFRPRIGTDDAIAYAISSSKNLPGKYVVGVLLDITGAFDHAWWPLIIDALNKRKVPSDIIATIASYFKNRRVVIDAGSGLVWGELRRGCPQGSVLGPLLWNILFDDVLGSPLPNGCDLIAYADDLLLLVSADTRASIETKSNEALSTIGEWGANSKLHFAPQKTQALLLRGHLSATRRPKITMNGNKIKFVPKARYLGMTISRNIDPCVHLRTAATKARDAFGKLSRLAGNTWGLNFKAKITMYKAVFVSIITYAASAWAERAARGLPRTILQTAQRTALKFVTASYNTAPTEALRVLAGVEPIDLVAQQKAAVFHLQRGRSATIAGARLVPPEGEPSPRAIHLAIRRITRAQVIDEWQRRWIESPSGLLTKKFLPNIPARLEKKWLRCDYFSTQFLTGHGAFNAYLHRFKLRDSPDCPCGEDLQTSEHLLWECPLLDEERATLNESLQLEDEGPPTHADMVSSVTNLRAFEQFCRSYNDRRDVRPT